MDQLGGKLNEDDKKTIEDAVDETIAWLDSNKDATVDDLKEQKKDLESKVQPIVSKLYQGQAPPEGGEAGGDEKDEL